MPSADALDAVTLDAFGTLVELRDPVPALRAALRERGVERDPDAVAQAFAGEVEHYLPRAVRGRDRQSLAELRRECAGVFLGGLGAELDAGSFAAAFVGALEFRLLPGAAEAIESLRSGGLALACVANWDVSLADHLGRVGIADRFHVIVSSAEARAQKPAPEIFEQALGRLGVEAGRALHCGDSEADRAGARAAGLAFEPTPLATLPERIGLRRVPGSS